MFSIIQRHFAHEQILIFSLNQSKLFQICFVLPIRYLFPWLRDLSWNGLGNSFLGFAPRRPGEAGDGLFTVFPVEPGVVGIILFVCFLCSCKTNLQVLLVLQQGYPRTES